MKLGFICPNIPGHLNTVLESLAQGVPQVAIPVTYDQPGVAARIAEKETGIVTSLALEDSHFCRMSLPGAIC